MFMLAENTRQEVGRSAKKKSFPFTKCLERKYIKRDHKHLRDTF